MKTIVISPRALLACRFGESSSNISSGFSLPWFYTLAASSGHEHKEWNIYAHNQEYVQTLPYIHAQSINNCELANPYTGWNGPIYGNMQ